MTWQTVVDEATEAWQTREGTSAEMRIEGVEAAAQLAGSSWGLFAQGRLGVPGAQETSLGVQAPVGLAVLARRRWLSEANAGRASAAHDQQRFVDRVLEAYTRWWTAQELAEHLEEWTAEVDRSLAPVDAAVASGLAARLDAEDLRAELATVRAEATAIRARAVQAEAELRALLGQEAQLEVGDVHLHDLDVSTLTNPWAALVLAAEEAPVVRVAEARAEAFEAQAAATSAWRPTVQAGVAVVDEGGSWAAMPQVGLQIPLRVAGAAKGRAARADGAAERHRARWLTERVQGAWRAEQAAFDAQVERVRRLDEEVVAPLTRRLERLMAAFDEGLVAVDRVVRARRDHHEAEHERLVIAAGLLASTARAEALRRILESE